MSTQILEALPASGPKIKDNGRDSSITRFAVVLPILMALLLALVPVLGTEAKVPFLLVLVPLALWAAFRDTERAIYVYIAWCWMDGTIRGVFDSNPVIAVARDLILAVITIGWAVQRLGALNTDRLRPPPGTLLVALFTINALLQIFNPFSLGLIQSLGGLKVHLSPLPLFFIAYDVIRRRGQVRSLFLFLTLATVVISLVSILQYEQGRDWTFAHFPGTKEVISLNVNASAGSGLTSDDTFKPPGTTTFGGGTAAFAGFIFPLTFVLMLGRSARLTPRMRGLFGAILFCFIITFFVNSLRSALVEAVLCVAACSMFVDARTRKRVLVGVGLCLVLGMVGWGSSQAITHGGSSDRFGSLLANPQKALHNDRQTFFEQFGDIVTKAPMGVGLGRTGAVAGHFGTTSRDIGFTAFSEAYLGNMIYETGIIGAVLIFLIALSFLVRGYGALRRLTSGDDKLLAAGLFSILFTLAANFFFLPVLAVLPGSVLFWLFGAVLLRVFAIPHSLAVQAHSATRIESNHL